MPVVRAWPYFGILRISDLRRVGLADDLISAQIVTSYLVWNMSCGAVRGAREFESPNLTANYEQASALLRDTVVSCVKDCPAYAIPEPVELFQQGSEVAIPLSHNKPRHIFQQEQGRLDFGNGPHELRHHVPLVPICEPLASGREWLARGSPGH
jgi:hypothetical protein